MLNVTSQLNETVWLLVVLGEKKVKLTILNRKNMQNYIIFLFTDTMCKYGLACTELKQLSK